MKKSFGIIGNPAKHSLSPLLHNYWFKKYKIEANYSILETEEKNLKNIVKKIKNKSLNGVNVTLPYKQKIINYSDKIINDAEVTGSVNTLLLNNEALVIGENTVISQRSYICTGTHDYNSEDFRIYAEDVNIGSKCWLATDVYIAPGINIEDGVVVGARSSVFSDLNANKVYVGSPAKSIKNRKLE